MTALSPRCSFSGTALKTIACITMLIDHIGASCIEAGILTPGLDSGTLSRDTLSTYPLYRLDMVLRFTGRLAFPIFCFLLVEGFVHTHNVKGYLGRLVLFGLLSEVPFDLAFFHTPFDFSAQNVYWTLALGVLAMAGLKRFEKPDGSASWKGLLCAAVHRGSRAVCLGAHRPAGLCAGLVLQRPAGPLHPCHAEGVLLVLPGAPERAGCGDESDLVTERPLSRNKFRGGGLLVSENGKSPVISKNHRAFSWRSRRDLNPRAVV